MSGGLDSAVMITWLSFIGVLILSCLFCCCYCLYIQHERRKQDDLNRDISRIEANVKVFSEQQNIKQKRCLLKSMAGQIIRISEEDLVVPRTPKGHSDTGDDDSDEEAPSKEESFPRPPPKEDLSETQSRIVEGCSICMEAFRVGENAMQSVTPDVCPHMFHETCIINWLVSRQRPFCPCCRQQFANVEEVRSPYRSEHYQEQLLADMGPDDV